MYVKCDYHSEHHAILIIHIRWLFGSSHQRLELQLVIVIVDCLGIVIKSQSV